MVEAVPIALVVLRVATSAYVQVREGYLITPLPFYFENSMFFFSFLGQVRRSEQKHNDKQRTHVHARTRVNALLWGMRMDMPARHLQLK